MFEALKNFDFSHPFENIITPGTYRLTFSTDIPFSLGSYGGLLPDSLDPFTTSQAGFKFDFSDYTIVRGDKGFFAITLVVSRDTSVATVNEAGIPLSTILTTAAGIAGIVFVYLTLTKVEKLVEGPAGSSLMIVLLLAAGGFFLFSAKSFNA